MDRIDESATVKLSWSVLYSAFCKNIQWIFKTLLCYIFTLLILFIALSQNKLRTYWKWWNLTSAQTPISVFLSVINAHSQGATSDETKQREGTVWNAYCDHKYSHMQLLEVWEKGNANNKRGLCKDVNLLCMKRKSPWEIVVKAKNDERIMHILLPTQKGKNYRLAIIVTWTQQHH